MTETHSSARGKAVQGAGDTMGLRARWVCSALTCVSMYQSRYGFVAASMSVALMKSMCSGAPSDVTTPMPRADRLAVRLPMACSIATARVRIGARG